MQEGRYVPNLDETYDQFALKYNWEYRENESQPWKPVQQLIDKMEDKNCLEIVQFYDGTEDTRANIGKTGFNVSFTNATSYADRNLLSGTQFRCTASALVLADEPDPNNNSETISTPWGVVSASVPDSQVLTVIINPKLLRSQVSSVRRITGFLTKDAADLWLNEATRDSVNLSDPNNIYNSSKSYEVKYFQDGVREERATADFPTSIVAVYEYQVSTGIDSIETRTAAVEIPVPWRFIVQNGRQYDLAATKAEYRYDAVLAEIIPQWNAEALQEYINSHDPNDLDYDEDAATKWVVAAGLNGRFPHVKVCWNTELAGLASNADYVKYNKLYGSGSDQTEKDKVAALAGSPVNPSAKDTLSDWYFHADQYPGKTGANEPMTEADQLQWLNEHYNTVKVTMDDVQSDLADPTPIVKELPISWKKVEITEYDTNSQSMTSRWLGDEATGVIQGISAAAAKWGWQATIDAVENGDYVASVGLRNTPVEANIYWSNVIDGIVGAVATNSVTATKETYRMLSNAARVDSNILPYLRVEYKDANGGTNIQAVVPIDKANWKVVDGGFAVADTSAPRGYSWTHPTKDDPYTSSTVPSAANAGYITLEPVLTGFTFTENADTTEAQVAYQWGTIITELMKSDGVSPYDPLMAAKTPIQIIPQIGGNDQTQAQWAKISAKFSKSFKTTIMDVSKTSGSSASTAAATWTKPNYNESTPAGKIQPGVKIDNYASGIVFGEDFLRDLGSRDIYGEASWKIAVPSVNSGSSSFIKWNSNSGQPYVSGASGQMTVYSDRPWECYYSTNTTGNVRQQTANFAPNAQDTWQNSANNDGVKYMVTTSSRGGAYVEWSVTFRNDSTGVRYVGLSYGSDVMIHSNDRAPLTKTETGFKMEEAQGDSCQFNINCTTATAGISVSADTRWIGHYSSRQHWTEAGGNYVSGIDSGLTFSWVPSRHPLQPGEQVTFTCQFGIGKMSDPPRMVPHYDSGSGRSTDVTMSGSKLNVSAWLAGDNKYQMTLYYILDEGLPTQQSEASVGGYTFTDIEDDHSVNVIYERDADAPVDPDVESFYILTSIDNGSITPTVTVTTDEEKASQTITWTPADGYRITGVTVDDAAIADFDPAGGAYEFTNITADHSVNVSCEKIPVYTVRTDGVNVSTITPTTTDIREGESFTVTWTPAAGMVLKDFKVDNVSVTLADGATSYTFDDIKANHRVYVEYGADVVEPETPDKVEISVMVTNGVKTGGGILRYGTASHTVTWAPSNGFVVKSVTIDNVPVPESTLQPNGGSFTFTSITADHSVVVVCEKEESGDTRKYYLEANIVNGLYDPYSMYGVYPDPEIRDGFAPGENFEISWAANDGYKVASVELDGVSRPDLITAGKLSLIGIRSDHALNVVCIDENDEPVVNEGPFTITTAINHGTISPTFTTTDKQNYYTVDWTADEAYEVVNVLVDGNAYPNWADGYITFNPITANHTVEVYAQLKEQPKDGEYVIDIIIDSGGTHDVTVDGKSVTVVKENSSAVASWQAAEGYDVSRIVIDGVSYTGLPGCTAQGGSYTFNKVTAGHRIVIYTTKHVEKPAVYYSISVLPYGDPNNVDLIAEAGGQSGKSLVAVLDDSEAAVHWNAKAGWKIDKVTRNDNIMTDAEVAAGMSDEGFRFKVNSDNNFVVYISEVKRVDESFLTVTTQITNGTISSGCSVQKGKSVDVTWLPNNGYEMTKVEITTELVDENGNVSTQTETYTDLGAYKYTLDNIQGNTTVSVTCEKAAENVKHSYQISSEVTNGTVTGTGTVVAGTSQMLTWMPAEGCSVSSVELYKVDDNGNIIAEVDISDRDGNSFTIADVDANYLLVLVCENNSHSDDDFAYDINTSITNGTINGPFLNLKKNGGALVEWMPNEGYHVTELRVDGVSQTKIPADYSLEVMVEGEDHTVEVICEKDPPIIINDGDDTRYVKTFIYDGSGEITPTTQVVVGSDFTVRWKPDDNLHYKVDRVYINGVNIPTPANNMTTLHIDKLMDENGDPKDYTVEVYLVENLVHVNVKYEGKGDVVKSGTVYYNEDFGIVQGIANVDEGYKLEKVYVNNVLLQPGEILVEYLPDPNSPLPLEQNPSSTSFAAKARKALNSVLNLFSVSADAADENNWDTPENRARVVDPVSGLQNTFYALPHQLQDPREYGRCRRGHRQHCPCRGPYPGAQGGQCRDRVCLSLRGGQGRRSAQGPQSQNCQDCAQPRPHR